MKERPAELYRLFIVARGISNLARTLGLSPHTVGNWKRVPKHHLQEIYRIYKIHPLELRPDAFDTKEKKKQDPQFYRRYKYRRFKLQWHELDPDPLD